MPPPAGPPNPGQPIPPGQPGQPFPPGQPYPPAGYAPVAGAPGYPGTPPAPTPPSSNKVVRIVAVVGVLVVVVGAVLAWYAFKNRDSGTSVETSPVGSCVTVSGSSMKVETKAVDCSDHSASTFIIGATLDSQNACKTGGYDYSVYEYGTGASDKVSCLIPNYQVGNCYEESTVSMGIGLKEVACSESSTVVTIRYKVTEGVDSKNVPNCTDPEKQKVLSYDVQGDSPRQVGYCAEILGDYTWEQ